MVLSFSLSCLGIDNSIYLVLSGDVSVFPVFTSEVALTHGHTEVLWSKLSYSATQIPEETDQSSSHYHTIAPNIEY